MGRYIRQTDNLNSILTTQYKTNMGLFDFFTKEHKEDLDKGLEKTKTGFFSKLTRAIAGKSKIDEEGPIAWKRPSYLLM